MRETNIEKDTAASCQKYRFELLVTSQLTSSLLTARI